MRTRYAEFFTGHAKLTIKYHHVILSRNRPYIIAALITSMLCLLAGAMIAMQPLRPRSRTIVVQELRLPNDKPLIPAPTALASPKLHAELAELAALQAKRTPDINARIAAVLTAPIQLWNETARNLVARNNLAPTRASRVYALLSAAQYDALQIAQSHREFFAAARPPDPYEYPASQAVIASASAQVLAELFPKDAASLIQQAKEQQELALYAGINLRSDLAAGEAIGQWAAQAVIIYARRDLSGELFAGVVPVGEGVWRSQLEALPTVTAGQSAPLTVPEIALGVTPHWGKTKPWLMDTGAQFRPPPPPAVGSAEYIAALDEVRRLSATRTPEELRVAQFWADGPSTFTPAGHWNKIAEDVMTEAGLRDPIRVAQIFATLNLAMADAGIACWDAKYTYWFLRPSQADPQISTPVGLPNFPAYTSGHACFSGAAAEVLAHYFPNRANDLRAAAKEAATSRLYAGIHWRFDSAAGLDIGHKVAALAIKAIASK